MHGLAYGSIDTRHSFMQRRLIRDERPRVLLIEQLGGAWLKISGLLCYSQVMNAFESLTVLISTASIPSSVTMFRSLSFL